MSAHGRPADSAIGYLSAGQQTGTSVTAMSIMADFHVNQNAAAGAVNQVTVHVWQHAPGGTVDLGTASATITVKSVEQDYYLEGSLPQYIPANQFWLNRAYLTIYVSGVQKAYFDAYNFGGGTFMPFTVKASSGDTITVEVRGNASNLSFSGLYISGPGLAKSLLSGGVSGTAGATGEMTGGGSMELP